MAGSSMVDIRRPSTAEKVVRAISTFVVAVPFAIGGATALASEDTPIWTGFVLLAVASVLAVTGLYMTLVQSHPSPRLTDGESIEVVRTPTMKPAYARMIFATPFLVFAWYLVEFTFAPYVYPFVTLVFGLWFYFGGAYRYWINQRTAYYITNRRVARIYEFLWLHTTEIPISRIVSISENRSFFEMLTGRGSVVVASGIGTRQTVRIADIDNPASVADALRATIE